MKPLRKRLCLLILAMTATFLRAQNTEGVSIKTTPSAPHASAMLDVESSNKGLLIPRVALSNYTSTSMMAVTPATGLLVFNTTTASPVSQGFYFWTGSAWKRLTTGPELWKEIGSGPDIKYDDGDVKIGSAATTNTQTYQFVVNTHTLEHHTALFETYNGGYLIFGDYNEILAESNSNDLTQVMASTGGGGAYPGRFNQLYPNGELGISITSDGKTLGAHANTSIQTGSNNDLLLIPGSGLLSIKAPTVQFCNAISGGICVVVDFSTPGITPSDSTLKKNILGEAPVIEKLRRCRPVTFNWKSDKEKQPLLNHGLIAQEVFNLFPELISENSISIVDEKTGVKEYKKAVNYNGFISVLIKAIQEQQAQIEKLEKRLDEIDKPGSPPVKRTATASK